MAYARRALSKGNFELAASLLDAANRRPVPLLLEIRTAQKEQDARQQRLKTARRIGALLVATILVVVTVAFFWIKSEYNRAETAKIAAEKSADAAIKEKKEAERQESIAVKAREDAVHAKNSAEASRAAEQLAKQDALDAKDDAEDAKDAAEEAQDEAEAAQKKEEYGAYIARIGLAAAKIDDNAFGMAARPAG